MSKTDIANERRQNEKPSKERIRTSVINKLTAGLRRYNDAQMALESVTLQRDKELADVEAKYADRMQMAKKKEQENFDELKSTTDANRDILFTDGKKTVKMDTGEVKYKTCPPKLETPEGKKLNDFVPEFEERFPQYIKTKKTVSAELIIADLDNMPMMNFLDSMGIRVVQSEKFIPKPKR